MNKYIRTILFLISLLLVAQVGNLHARKPLMSWLHDLPDGKSLYTSRTRYIQDDATNYEIDISTSINVTGSITGTTFIPSGNSEITYVVASDSTTVTASSTTYVTCSKNGIMSVTLPTAVGNEGVHFHIKKTGTAGAVTIITNGSETIDGVDDPAIVDAQYDFLEFYSNGSNWLVINRYIQ